MKNNNVDNKNITTTTQYVENEYSIPKDRNSLNAAYRSAFTTQPLVNTIINTHTEIALKFCKIQFSGLKISDEFFENQIQSIELFANLQSIIREYWLVGESFIYAELDETKNKWGRILIQNPDYIIVKRTPVGALKYFLRPDENLRRIIFSNKEEDVKERKLFDSRLVDSVKRGENIELDNFYITHICRKISPYELRGTGILAPVLQFINSNNDDPEIIAQIKNCLIDLNFNKNINISRAYTNYKTLFSDIEKFVSNKIFEPVAKMNELYEYKDGEKKTSIPNIHFDLDGLIKDLQQ